MGAFWIRYRPRRWPHAARPWVDLARASVGLPEAAPAASSPLRQADLDAAPPDDVLYLPPCDDPDVAAQLATWASRAVPAVVQRRIGQAPLGVSALQVWDPLAELLDDDRAWVEGVPAGAAVVWPLLPGLPPDEGVFQSACERLLERGVRVVQPLRLTPEAAALRALAELHPKLEEDWERLFHGDEVDERRFCATAASIGLEVKLQRPGLPGDESPGRPLARTGSPAGNRAIVTVLTEVGELWLRLGRSESSAQEFFSAARRAEQSPWELSALWRDGNLQVLDWLGSAPRQVVIEMLEDRECPTLDGLWREYSS